jgi:hypothetical protein
MRIALAGATGFVGQSAAVDLAGRPEVRELLLVDYDIRAAKQFARRLSRKCRWAMADAGREADLGRLLSGIDAVASAVGPCREYERRILLTCAASGTPAASIGDAPLPPEVRREIDDAFRTHGAAAVSGCGMLPGWTDLLESHFVSGGAVGETDGRDRGLPKFLFCSLDRFGGYAFFRKVVQEAGTRVSAPPGAPPGDYVDMGRGWLLGVPSGRQTSMLRRLAGPGPFGAVGRELSAAVLFWLRRFLAGGMELPAAAAGVFDSRPGSSRRAAVFDPHGRLAGALLAETAVALARTRRTGKGLLSLPEVVGRGDAERIAASCGATITVG